jgi:hypothetical protein
VDRRYERDLTDILQIQAEVAHSIAGQIRELVDGEHVLPAKERQSIRMRLKPVRRETSFTTK